MKFIQNIDFMRKKPIQKRSEATINVILEATTQILDREGEKALNTNEIAARSGFSIGTLYQYFKNKDAIINALAEREFGAAREKFDALIGSHRDVTREVAVRAVVRALVEPFAQRPKARRAVVLYLAKRIDLVVVRKLANDMAARLFERMRFHPGFNGVPSRLKQSLLVSAVLGAVRGTLISEPESLASQGFEDELVALIIAYIDAPSSS